MLCMYYRYIYFFAGIAFPTCVSVNNCICHFSPLKSDPDRELADGDVVKMWVRVVFFKYNLKWMMIKLLALFAFHWRNGQKSAYFHIVLGMHVYFLSCLKLIKQDTFVFNRDLGAQIDGYIAVIAHTLVVGASKVSCALWKNYLVGPRIQNWMIGSQYQLHSVKVIYTKLLETPGNIKNK